MEHEIRLPFTMDSANSFSIIINGKLEVIRDVDPTENLLTWLRRNGRTGSKEGCAEGDCGACSVVLVDTDAEGKTVYRAIDSCLALLPSLAGREIITVEGIGCSKNLHPVQKAMVAHYGSQCGYCTPGFVASLFEGYYRKELTTPEQIADQLCGNLCRCTGYRPIGAAASALFRSRTDDAFTERLSRPVKVGRLKYARGRTAFLRPDTLREVLELSETLSSARLVAGSTEIAVEVNKLGREVPVLISTEAVPELNVLRQKENYWEIGAACSLTRIEEKLRGEFPALDQMLRLFASRQIRNRATMGGNLATASPIGDCAPVLLTLEAKLVLVSRKRNRVVPIEDFFTGYRKTDLQPGEIISAIQIPLAAKTGLASFFKVSKRREMEISAVSACFRVETNSSRKVTLARIAYGGVAVVPLRLREVEGLLIGRTLEESLAEVKSKLADTVHPITDVRATAEYRIGVVCSLWEKFVAGEESVILPFVESKCAVRDEVLRHESGIGHATGEAQYVEDQALRRPMLETWLVLATEARARIISIDIEAAKVAPGVSSVLLASDIPGMNNIGHTVHDEPLLVDQEVFYHGQPIALIVGESKELCRKAAKLVRVEYEVLPPVLGIEAAITANSYHTEPHRLVRGDFESAFVSAPHRLEGVFRIGGQEHLYLETQAAWAEITDDGGVFVSSSTQHPSEIQAIVGELLGLHSNQVVVEAPRMGGGFGGKETQGNLPAALVALAAKKTGRPVRIQLERDVDMMVTGKRHPFRAEYQAGYAEDGRLLAVKVTLISDGGWALDLSMPVNDRALFHLDNAYYIPAVDFTGRVAKTNVTSQTAFRGFGGPQGMLVMEEILARIASQLGLPPEEVRRRNFYHGSGETNTTHYGEVIEDNRLERIWTRLLAESEFQTRREKTRQWNREQHFRKRGIAVTPVKFGISFTLKSMNQAGALVLLYQDGTAQVNHGGTEMGQGLHTKVLGVAMRELGLPADRIRIMPTRTDKVPNTTPTAASCGSDLNGAAVADACRKLMTRLAPVAAKLLGRITGSPVPDDELLWSDGGVVWKTDPAVRIPFETVTRQAWVERVSMSATGYYKTPQIYWDWRKGKGKPFHYFAFGAAVSEVEVDVATGMTQVLRVDILHDVGDSLNPGVDLGQVEGGFVQGMGWLTSEELLWDDKGRLLTHSASTYQIPSIGDMPRDFRVKFLENAGQARTIGNSKAVGEPPLMLAFSVREAIRDAIAQQRNVADYFELASPATPEAVFRAMHPELFQTRMPVRS